tara:strand:- start:404 stop:976 length:573 start_codon:yes stop_codon:yes gene_type:complete
MNPYLDYNPKHTNKEKYLKMYKATKRPRSMIDLGSGSGMDSFAWSHHVDSVYGVDPSERMLKRARKDKNKYFKDSNIRFYKGDLLNIPIKKVDMIFVKNVLHFSKNIKEALDNVMNHTNNYLVILEPGYKSKFGNDIYNPGTKLFDKKEHKKKIDELKRTRKGIKEYIETCDVVVEKESDLKYFVIIKKK